jgi:hypothetical protein
MLIAFSWNYQSNPHNVPHTGRAIIDGMVRNDIVFHPATLKFESRSEEAKICRLDLYLESIKEMKDSCRIWMHYEDAGVHRKECIWYYKS